MAASNAVFALGLLLGCGVAVARSSIKPKDLLAADMTMDSALLTLNGKLPANIASLVAKSRDRRHTFLQRAHGASTGAVDKKNVEEAREKLNEMIEETQKNLDTEDVECKESIRNKKEVIAQTTADIALYDSQETSSNADHLRADTTIGTLDSTQGRMKDELAETVEDCKEQIDASKLQIAIMKNDSEVLGRIVDMIECPKTALLVQCTENHATDTTFAHPELRAEMAQLTSDKAKGLLKTAVDETYSTAGTFTVSAYSKAAFFQEGGLQHQRRLKQTPTVSPQATTDVAEGYPVEQPKYEAEPTGCSLASNPNCGKFVDTFMEIKGQVDSDIDESEEHLETRTEECKVMKENLETQIGDIVNRVGKWQLALAEAADRGIQARSGSKTKREQLKGLLEDFKATKSECDETVGNLKSEMCALGKIRGELYKLSEVPKFISDCEVSDWIYGDCSSPCETGEQNLTRSVDVPTDLGAACPPLEAKMVCNTMACPIDCDMDEWSEWSGCSVQCGGGVRERIRAIRHYSRHGGEPCGEASETEGCNIQNCDKDCTLGQWTKISSVRCTKACGGGVKVSTRPVIEEAIGEGTCEEMCDDPTNCPERLRLTTCNVEPCVPEGLTLMCQSMVDVIILLDGSGSLGQTGWAATVAMGEQLVNAFSHEGSTAQVAVQLFSGPSTITSLLRCFFGSWAGKAANQKTDCGLEWVTPVGANGHFATDMKKTEGEIKAMPWPASSTYTSGALSQALAELTYARAEAAKVVVVITDGLPLSPYHTSKAAMKLKKEAKVVWVAVGPKAPHEFLHEWASAPSSQNVVAVADFEALESPDITTQIVAGVCEQVK